MQAILQLELTDKTKRYATSVFMVPAALRALVAKELARHDTLPALCSEEHTSGLRDRITSYLQRQALKRARRQSLNQLGSVIEQALEDGAYVAASLVCNLPVVDPDCMAATGTWHGKQADKNISVISPIAEFSLPTWLDYVQFKFFTTEFRVAKDTLVSVELKPLTASILADARVLGAVTHDAVKAA